MFEYSLKERKDNPSSMFEVARTKDGFLFDELIVLGVSMNRNGSDFKVEYRRAEERLTDITVFVGAQMFADARSGLLKSAMVQHMFSEACRQYLKSKEVAKTDFESNMEFLQQISAGQIEG